MDNSVKKHPESYEYALARFLEKNPRGKCLALPTKRPSEEDPILLPFWPEYRWKYGFWPWCYEFAYAGYLRAGPLLISKLQERQNEKRDLTDEMLTENRCWPDGLYDDLRDYNMNLKNRKGATFPGDHHVRFRKQAKATYWLRELSKTRQEMYENNEVTSFQKPNPAHPSRYSLDSIGHGRGSHDFHIGGSAAIPSNRLPLHNPARNASELAFTREELRTPSRMSSWCCCKSRRQGKAPRRMHGSRGKQKDRVSKGTQQRR